MAEHRLNSRLRQDLRLLRPVELRQLSFLACLWPVIQLLVFGVALPVAWLTQGEGAAAIGFAVISLFGFAVELVMAGRARRLRLEQNSRESELLDLAARVPNGAPEVAYVRHHCGCIYRHQWDGESWVQDIHVASEGLGDSCPLAGVSDAHDR